MPWAFAPAVANAQYALTMRTYQRPPKALCLSFAMLMASCFVSNGPKHSKILDPLSLIFRRKLLNLPAVHLVRAAHVLLQPSRRPLHLYISAAFCCYIDYYVYMRIYTYIKVMWYQRPSRPPLAPAPASRCKASCRGGGELTSLQVSLRIISDE